MTHVSLVDILVRSIPIQSELLKAKAGYREYPLLVESPRAKEPLVDIGLYGLAGQSYYSRPNRATGDPVPGVDPIVRVRKSIAEQLAAINYEVQNAELLTKVFGQPVELYIEEGMRSPQMQRQLYEEIFPRFISQRQPALHEAEVLAERDKLIAKPSDARSTPSPHSTGAAVDVCLRYAQPDLGFVAKSLILMGQKAGFSKNARPDYFETKESLSTTDKRMRQNRRIFYWVMRGALLHDDSGFMVNPDEWWHWSYGDQLWAALTNAPCAFFGEVTTSNK
jgi:D-alanyl-D-alanine dipeptidase